jgi:hypothetical protein
MSSTFHKDEVDSRKQRPVASILVASTDYPDGKIAKEPSMVYKK